jgi:hypothetical protein
MVVGGRSVIVFDLDVCESWVAGVERDKKEKRREEREREP